MLLASDVLGTEKALLYFYHGVQHSLLVLDDRRLKLLLDLLDLIHRLADVLLLGAVLLEQVHNHGLQLAA